MVNTPLFTAVDVDSVIKLTFVAWDYVALEIKWQIQNTYPITANFCDHKS